MNILFITAGQYLPQVYGGLQTSTDHLCRGLLKKGHKVSVLASFIRKGLFAWKCSIQKKLLRRTVSRDTVLGYPVWRSWFPWDEIEYVAGIEKPDLIVVTAVLPVRMALAAKPTGIPLLVMLLDVEKHLLGGRFEDLGNIPCIANSNFTAERYRRDYGVDPAVIYHFIPAEKYKTESAKENITFINPIPEKGRDIALEIARLCPDIPFSFIEGRHLSDEDRKKLSALPNVTLSLPQPDMRKVYRKCKILLAPSVWEEAYGMVVTEAQMSGIPVIASTRGGLPEAVGPGGILIDPEGPIENWIKAVRKLWQDDKYYAELSAAALTYAQRQEMNPAYQMSAYETAFEAAIDDQSKQGAPDPERLKA